jgi:hypothetical protein
MQNYFFILSLFLIAIPCPSSNIATDDGDLDQNKELAVSLINNGVVCFKIVSTNEKHLSANAAEA